MKGIVLAGGTGWRLSPLTTVVNKHLLPVYNKPMIYYPVEMLRNSGITDILVIVGGNSVGNVLNLLSNGEESGVKITYRHQSKPDGIAGALKLARDFVKDEDFAVILGDNIFEHHIENLQAKYEASKDTHKPTSMLFLAPTDRPKSFGIPTFSRDKTTIIKITEKPKKPASNYAITGLYVYDRNVWNMIDYLKPSDRNELEITDINNWYILNGFVKYEMVNGWWYDAGSHRSLLIVSMLAAGISMEQIQILMKDIK